MDQLQNIWTNLQTPWGIGAVAAFVVYLGWTYRDKWLPLVKGVVPSLPTSKPDSVDHVKATVQTAGFLESHGCISEAKAMRDCLPVVALHQYETESHE